MINANKLLTQIAKRQYVLINDTLSEQNILSSHNTKQTSIHQIINILKTNAFVFMGVV